MAVDLKLQSVSLTESASRQSMILPKASCYFELNPYNAATKITYCNFIDGETGSVGASLQSSFPFTLLPSKKEFSQRESAYLPSVCAACRGSSVFLPSQVNLGPAVPLKDYSRGQLNMVAVGRFRRR